MRCEMLFTVFSLFFPSHFQAAPNSQKIRENLQTWRIRVNNSVTFLIVWRMWSGNFKLNFSGLLTRGAFESSEIKVCIRIADKKLWNICRMTKLQICHKTCPLQTANSRKNKIKTEAVNKILIKSKFVFYFYGEAKCWHRLVLMGIFTAATFPFSSKF